MGFETEKILIEIRKKIFKDHVELLKIFKDHDKDELGIINTISFTYLVNEYLGVPEEKIVSLVKLMDPNNKNLVSYMDFMRLVHDPNALENMPLFKLGDQARNDMMEKQKDHSRVSGQMNIPPVPIDSRYDNPAMDTAVRYMSGPDRDDRNEKKATKSVGMAGF